MKYSANSVWENKDAYDIVVVGAGHAGCEAALACARLGLKTIVFTVSVESIAMMPCNPNIGGTSKGHLVRELDALGGEMGKNIDKTFIPCAPRQIRTNTAIPCDRRWKTRITWRSGKVKSSISLWKMVL